MDISTFIDEEQGITGWGQSAASVRPKAWNQAPYLLPLQAIMCYYISI